MFNRRALGVIAASFGSVSLVTPVLAHAATEPATVDAHTLTPGRLLGTAAALVALAGVVIGGLALARSAGRTGKGSGKKGAVVGLTAGLTGIILGGIVVAAAKGGPGTGYGIVGGFVALVLGLIATILGILALAHSRRARLIH
ncbi:DUF6223 family protein [Nocardia sp. NPDC004260]